MAMNVLLFLCVCAMTALHVQVDAAKGKFQLIWETLNRTDDQASYMPSDKIVTTAIFKPKLLSKFDTETSSLDIYYEFVNIWKDETSTLNSEDLEPLLEITLAADKVWTPEIVPLNALSSKDLFGSQITIKYDSNIEQRRLLQSRVFCQQISGNSTQRMCSLTFGSWKYMSRVTIGRLNLQQLENLKTDVLEYSGWSYKDLNITREEGTDLPTVNIFIERDPIKPENITTATEEATKGTEAKQQVSVAKESTIKFENKMTKLEITGENANSKILEDTLAKQKK